MKKIFTNPKFLLALVALVQSIVLEYINVPPTIWANIDILIGVIIVIVTGEEVVVAIRALNLRLDDVSKAIRSMKK